jgi:hypothetical protein
MSENSPKPDEGAGGRGGGGGLFTNPKHFQTDMKMIERAIKNRWPISDELKAKIAERVSGIVEHSDSTRDVINAARVAIQADGLNAKREAMELDAERGPEIHLHAHTGTEAARQVIESEPDYLEYLRNKALESGSSDS